MMPRTLAAIALLVASACTVGYAPPPATTAAAEVGPEPRGGERAPWTGEIHCVGSRDLVIRDAIIEVAGDGPTVTGSCVITIINSSIVAGEIAAVVRGSGAIHIRGSYIEGAGGAASIAGSGELTIEDSEVVGELSVLGSGDIALSGSVVRGGQRVVGSGTIRDEGGNQWR